jgi:ADP-dependent phosphofructokinase/glucokinase
LCYVAFILIHKETVYYPQFAYGKLRLKEAKEIAQDRSVSYMPELAQGTL